jgi:hypothetical protein
MEERGSSQEGTIDGDMDVRVLLLTQTPKTKKMEAR